MTDINIFLAGTERLADLALEAIEARNRLAAARDLGEDYAVRIAATDEAEVREEMRQIVQRGHGVVYRLADRPGK